MSTIELNAVRKEIANEILNEKNEILLLKILDFIHTAKKTMLQPPCQFSVEELKTEVMKSEDDFKNGRYLDEDEIVHISAIWDCRRNPDTLIKEFE